MTPAAKKPRKLKPAEIKSSGNRPVVVDRVDDDTVKITWVCGATREFTPADLRQAVQTFELLASYGDGIPLWMQNADSTGVSYHARLTDGRFHGDDSSRADSSYSVPWPTFKKALLARAK